TGQSVVSFNHTPYPVVCPGDRLVFTCVVEGTNGAVAWKNNQHVAVLTTSSAIPLLDDFTLSITSYDNGVLVSAATNLSVPVQLNGSTISCSSDAIHYDTLTINIAGPPITPVSSIATTAITNDVLLINWSYSDSCIDHYIITVNSNNTHNESRTTNNTNINIDTLIVGNNYSFIIIPIDTIGREGSPSSLIQYIWNVPAQVVNISWYQISTDSITIWWNNEDTTTLRPPIDYNVTDTNTTITGLSPINEYYTVTIIPVNVIGYGPSVTVNVNITTSISSVSSVSIITKDVSSSNSMMTSTITTTEYITLHTTSSVLIVSTKTQSAVESHTTEYITTQDKSLAVTANTVTETISSCADILISLIDVLMATTGIYWCLVLTECLCFLVL
uniref:Fibronectin type-III domain-containing protein n=1 Tax=Amphimedon queenslandica TaxID=400682 RepID=A0A1X7UGH7_AMPQE